MKLLPGHYIKEPIHQEYATKLSLIGIFITLFTAFTSLTPRMPKKQRNARIELMDLALLGLSTYRLGRLISYDRVTEPLRRPFTKTVPDETGAGMSVEPRGEGVRQTFGQLLSCPICSGTWIAAGLVYARETFPGPTRLFMTIMSATGIAELLNALTEALTWTGQAARWKAGRKARKKIHKPLAMQKEIKTNGRDYQKYYR